MSVIIRTKSLRPWMAGLLACGLRKKLITSYLYTAGAFLPPTTLLPESSFLQAGTCTDLYSSRPYAKSFVPCKKEIRCLHSAPGPAGLRT